MKNNEELQKDVQDAIKWEPLLSAAEIGVIAKDGVVTLSGTVDSYAKKIEAEDATKNVAGVKAVVEKIDIKFSGMGSIDDSEIANEVLNALKWNLEVPHEKIKVKVEEGWITLEGDLHWNYQKDSATKSVKHLIGVKGVTNHIKIQPESKNEIEKKLVESALRRNWSIDDSKIQVKVAGTQVFLDGTVHSLFQKAEAGRIAWNTPGVWIVENHLVVDYK